MATTWTRRGYIFVNASIITQAKAKAIAIMPDVAEHLMFDAVRLSQSGSEPARAGVQT